MSKYTTGELAKLCGVSVRTVQYYDNREILCPTELSEGGRRLYSEDDLKRMKTICFLRDTGLSINSIGELMREDNASDVVSLMLDQHEQLLTDELIATKAKLEKLRELKQAVKLTENFSANLLSDRENIMESRQKLKRVYTTIFLVALPLTAFQWATIALWIIAGIWWPFAAQYALTIPAAVWVSHYYFSRVSYVCPRCSTIFSPKFKEAFFANHTPKTRKLTCPGCREKSFCVEIYKKEDVQS